MPFARLLPRFAQTHPGLSPSLWYRVAAREAQPAGYWLEGAGGDPFLTQGRLFVAAHHLEVREE